MKALLFYTDKYDMKDLSQMNECELYELAKEGRKKVRDTRIMFLEDFQNALNRDYLCIDNWWVFFIQ